jgi:hypothetical protein
VCHACANLRGGADAWRRQEALGGVVDGLRSILAPFYTAKGGVERAGFPPKLPLGNFAERSPSASDPVVLLDSTPVEAPRSADTPGPACSRKPPVWP